MRTRRPSQDQVAEVARRRLELLSAELAEIRPRLSPDQTDRHGVADGQGGPSGGDAAGALVDVPATGVPASTAPPGAVPPGAVPPGAVPPGAAPPGAAAPGAAPPGRHAHRSVGASGAASGWLEDRLPPALQGRVRMSGAHLLVVALVALAGVALTAGWVARAQGNATVVPPAGAGPATAAGTAGGASGEPLVTPAPQAGATSGAAAGPGAPGAEGSQGAPGPSGMPTDGGPAPGAAVVVDVAGKVRRPGIATLPPGSRVVDALEAAGGARPGARLGSLNLARVLVDGEQVVVGLPAPPGVAASAASVPSAPAAGASGALVNLNTASVTELEVLPGVGPVTAQAIVDFRTENGGFTAVDELLEVSGIGDATLAEIAPHATL